MNVNLMNEIIIGNDLSYALQSIPRPFLRVNIMPRCVAHYILKGLHFNCIHQYNKLSLLLSSTGKL